MKTIGIDLSLTGTGLVVYDGSEIVEQILIRTKPSGESILAELERLRVILGKIQESIDKHEPELVATEGLAFMARNTTALVQLAGLNYLLRNQLYNQEISFVIISPSTLKKYATGKGSAQKDHVMLEIYKEYGITLLDNNIADAFIMSVIAFELLKPSDRISKPKQEVLDLLAKQIDHEPTTKRRKK